MAASILQIRRGAETARTEQVFASGEPAFTIDTKKLFLGDGLTPGGIEIGGGVFKIIPIIDERPVGAINGTNLEFLIKFPFMDDRLKIKVNGLPQLEGADNDYTLVWPNKIIFNDAPWQGDQILVDYNTQQ